MLLYKSKIVFPSIIYSEYAFIIRAQVEAGWLRMEKISARSSRNSLNIVVKSRVSDSGTDNRLPKFKGRYQRLRPFYNNEEADRTH